MAKPKRVSAGLVPFRMREGRLEVLLVHPGGPLWKNRDAGAWSIAKGELGESEALLAAAEREFREETGFEPHPPYLALGSVRQKGGKEVHAWAFEADLDPEALVANHFELEWPPRSGRRATFPEVDRAAWCTPEQAKIRLNSAQVPLLEALHRILSTASE